MEMLRTIIWFIYFWWTAAIPYPTLKRANRLKEEGKNQEYADLVEACTRKWSLGLLKKAGVTVQVQGLEHVPKNEPVLFVSNHQGNFDIPILIGCIPKYKGFIAKVELEKIPIITTWMRHLQCVFMDRSNSRQSVKSIIEGANLLKSGHSMVVFPEGTRSMDGTMGEFKAGALKLATRAKVNIVPVTISGSGKIMEKGSWLIRPQKVSLTIHPLFSTESYKDKDTQKLAEDVETIIKRAL